MLELVVLLDPTVNLLGVNQHPAAGENVQSEQEDVDSFSPLEQVVQEVLLPMHKVTQLVDQVSQRSLDFECVCDADQLQTEADSEPSVCTRLLVCLIAPGNTHG